MGGPVELVQQQVDAYIKCDIGAFLACYAADAVIRDGDGNVLMTGHDEMRDQYAHFFDANPDLMVEVCNRVHIDSWVVDYEHIRYGSDDVRAIVGYRLQEGLIQAVVLMCDG